MADSKTKISINKSDLVSTIKDEVSRIADKAYDGQGNSLYDGVIIYSNDEETIDTLLSESERAVRIRLADIIKPQEATTTEETTTEDTAEDTATTGGTITMEFDIPDCDPALVELAQADICRYLTLNVCASWFNEHLADKVENFSERALAALDRAATELKTRKKPTIVRKKS